MANGKPKIVDAEGELAKVKEGKKPPTTLIVIGRVIRMLEKLDRRGRVNVVNFVTTHFGLNEPPPPADQK